MIYQLPVQKFNDSYSRYVIDDRQTTDRQTTKR